MAFAFDYRRIGVALVKDLAPFGHRDRLAIGDLGAMPEYRTVSSSRSLSS